MVHYVCFTLFHYVILQQIQNKEKSSFACAVAVNVAFAHDNCQYCRHLSQRVATESLEASACRSKFALTHSEKTSAFARQHSSAFVSIRQHLLICRRSTSVRHKTLGITGRLYVSRKTRLRPVRRLSQGCVTKVN